MINWLWLFAAFFAGAICLVMIAACCAAGDADRADEARRERMEHSDVN